MALYGKSRMNEESRRPPCRLHALVASEADVGVVFRKGPSRWWHILKWDLQTHKLQSGAWVKGKMYPRRSAISPDGKLLCYFIFRRFYPADPEYPWDAYFAVSKIPWLTALAAWRTRWIWTTGCWFGHDGELTISWLPPGPKEPFHGNYPGKINHNPVLTKWEARFLQELKSGWRLIDNDWLSENREYLRSALPPSKQVWPRPPAGLMKYRPRNMAMLIQLDWGYESARHKVEGTHAIDSRMPEYMLQHASRKLEHLGRLRWADWDHQGNVLAATWNGELRVYQLQENDTLKCLIQHDLNPMEPSPMNSPIWAKQW